MRTKKSITVLTLLMVCIFSLNIASCEQEDLDFYIDCDFCLEEIPEFDTLWVTLTINEENPFVPLEFYLGNYEDGDIDWVDTAYEERFWLAGSVVEQEYSVKATYLKDGQTLIAVDGDKIQVVDGEGECYPPCFYTRGGTLDVRLKE